MGPGFDAVFATYIQDVTPPVSVASLGNVGISTPSPQRALHITDVMRLETRASAPLNASAGDVYYDGTTNRLRYYNATTWVDL